MSEQPRRISRGSFLRQVGVTLAAGVGLAAAPSLARADATPQGERQDEEPASGCAIYCYENSPFCYDCPPGKRRFRCVSQCGGTEYMCLTRSTCTGFCYSPNVC